MRAREFITEFVAEGTEQTMSVPEILAYLKKVMGTESHQDWRNDVINNNDYFVLKDIPLSSLWIDLPMLDRANVEKYKSMDFSKSPPIVVGSNGHIIDGYHRANVAKALKIPTLKAWVGVKKQNVAEGTYDSETFNIKRRPLNVPLLIQRGAIFVTYPHGDDGWETDAKEDWQFSLITLLNVLSGGWAAEAKQHLKPNSYKKAEQQINSSAPNLGNDTLVYDGKYNQILWSIKRLGLGEQAFIDRT